MTTKNALPPESFCGVSACRLEPMYKLNATAATVYYIFIR